MYDTKSMGDVSEKQRAKTPRYIRRFSNETRGKLPLHIMSRVRFTPTGGFGWIKVAFYLVQHVK